MITELTFKVPDRSAYNNVYYRYFYSSLREIKSRTRFICDLIKHNKLIITWDCPDTKLMLKLKSIVRTIKSPNMSPIKEDLVALYAACMSSPHNLLLVAEHFATDKTKEIAETLASQGLVSATKLFASLKWGTPHQSWYSVMSEEDLAKYRTDSKTAPVAPMTYLIYGPSAESKYYSSRTEYYGAFPVLVQYYLKYIKRVALTEFTYTEELTTFDGTDVLSQQQVLQQLLLTGSIKLGKNKLTKTGVAKCQEMTNLNAFPAEDEDTGTRMGLLLNAIYNINVDDFLEYEQPTSILPAEDWFTKLAMALNDPLVRDINYMLGQGVKISTKLFINEQSDDLETMRELIFVLLKNISKDFGDKWIDMQSFIDVLNLKMAEKGVFYFLANELDKESALPHYSDGTLIAPKDYKARVHDKLVEGYIKSFASSGFINLLFDKTGKVVAVKPTALADWFNGLINELPTIIKEEVVTVFNIDDDTRIVTVKAPSHPYAPIIAEFAEKLGKDRWVITKASMLKGCKTSEDFHCKLDRFKTFITPTLQGEIKKLVDEIIAQTGNVQRTAGGTTYFLYDINPKDKALHHLIATDPRIHQYTLKVEGCRLLIKESFLDEFLKILRKHGYLNSERL